MTLKPDEKGVGLFQVPIPFGADYGGVNRELYKVKGSSQFDTWVTVGADNGNPSNQIRCGHISLPSPTLSWVKLCLSRADPPSALVRGTSDSLSFFTARLAWVRSTRCSKCRTVRCSR